jgi:hypothetical protein
VLLKKPLPAAKSHKHFLHLHYSKKNFFCIRSTVKTEVLPDFCWYKIPKGEKFYQTTTNIFKCPYLLAVK